MEYESELLWVELKCNTLSVLFGIFYQPPNESMSSLLHIKQVLSSLPAASSVILCGDFNAHGID